MGYHIVIILSIVFCATCFESPGRTAFPGSMMRRDPGHYPGYYYSISNVLLNPSSKTFQINSKRAKSERFLNKPWPIETVTEPMVTCDEVHNKGYVFVIFYHYDSNYFHMHVDTLMPLFKAIYYKQENRNRPVVIIPAVEKERLESLDWETPAFDNSSIYWMQMLKFISGRNKLLPLNAKLLARGQNICFREISFGTSSYTVFPEHEDIILKYIKFVRDQFQIVMPQPHSKIRVGLIKRTGRRLILNEDDIIKAVKPFTEIDVINFDGMTFRKQIEVVQKYSVLIGMNGAGLINALFAPPFTCAVQLVPYEAQTNHKAFGTLLTAKGPYLEWHNQHKDLHFVKADGTNHNADTVVNVDEFRKLVREALEWARQARHNYREEL
ncbi:protein O-linked-mannose beta-1,4-N-acetylglucosaminyltransferase 2-like [Lineus longissimus]|uniref:protein O-linked-mannose beta-1,4-N-acetylglucosaminyltransferase 2-like n=1 Tax=Lineus longissimus TaxID=88925 RepID=UPI002B4CDC72